MHEDVSDIIARRRIDPAGLSRIMSMSIAIHAITVTLVLVVPRSWLTREHEKPLLMTISLGGSAGERSGGMVSAGARPVEKVAPPPTRPEPIKPAVHLKPDEIALPAKTPPKVTPKPVEPTVGATTPLPRPPVTGTQVQKGTATADTGSTSQGTGLTFGGGAGGAMATVDSDFCCKEYLEEMIRRINTKWDKNQPETGSTTIVFEIKRDGTFSKPEVEKTSGSLALDVASKAAFANLKLQPLPREYSPDTLKIHLTFPYVR